VRVRHQAEIDALEPRKRLGRLIELNVITQVHHLKSIRIVQEAIKEWGLQVHGLVYGVGTGHVEILEIPDVLDGELKAVPE